MRHIAPRVATHVAVDFSTPPSEMERVVFFYSEPTSAAASASASSPLITETLLDGIPTWHYFERKIKD